jgi:hypothetical protein
LEGIIVLRWVVRALITGSILAGVFLGASPGDSAAQSTTSRYFPETKHSVKGVFLKYWEEHGGLAQQGYPLTEEFTEVSDLDGKSYTVQYFERAVFEKHPENSPPHDVLLSQLGTFQYRAKYGEAGAASQQASTQNARLFPETGYSVGGPFLDYWLKNGGLAQQGYPISNEFTEVSELDGKPYTVQYFERAVFEMHPENKPPYNVLLSQLGTFQLKEKYPNGAPGGEGQPQPEPTQPVPGAQPTNTPTGTNCEQVEESRKSRKTSTGHVSIADVQYAGKEFVTIKNNNSSAVDISGWLLRDKNDSDQSFRFPSGTQIAAGGTVEVYTERGHPYSFNSGSPIWNNCGDALELVDAAGAVVATYAYGTHLIP